jgi:hypothetical protein
VGYLPANLPLGSHTEDSRYRMIRKTPSDHFSALEACQYWTDIIGSGIRPIDVKVIAIGGGTVSAAEYRIALALGAEVGIFEDSGGAAVDLHKDHDWNTNPGIVRLPSDAEAIRAFITKDTCILNLGEREDLARTHHRKYQNMQGPEKLKTIPELRDWDDLNKTFRESNLQWVDNISTKLNEFGYSLKRVAGKPGVPVKFSLEEIEGMAEMEHGRWVVERFRDGWRYGAKKDAEKKISPYLVPWVELADEVKEWDRKPIRELPVMLAEMGYEIYR